MNKLIIALVVVLIGIQSWTLKTQQQILEVVQPKETITLQAKIDEEELIWKEFPISNCEYLIKNLGSWVALARSSEKFANNIDFSKETDATLFPKLNKLEESETNSLQRAYYFGNLYNILCKE
tara:strand:- start:242 stop:610 length:369 start_codon:yes stop_codon:yes gene_type:complete